MGSRRLLHLLSIFWLGLAAVGLLGHYVADAIDMGCQARFIEPCQATEDNLSAQMSSGNATSMNGLHAGIDLPSAAAAWSGAALVLATTAVTLPPITRKISPPSPPPQ